MTTHTPTPPESAAQGVRRSRPALDQHLEAWLDHVERGVRVRGRVEALIATRGVLRPVSMGRRFLIKSQEIGVRATVTLAASRVRDRMRRGE